MAAVLSSSPELACTSSFRSPLRNLRAETYENAGSQDLYADAQIRLTQWRKDLMSSANFEAQQGIRDLRHESEHLRDLQADLAGVRGLVESASQLQAGGARLAEVMHSSKAAAGSRAQAATQIRDELHASCERCKLEHERQERNLAQQREAADTHHTEALKLLGTYSERLGLTITRVAPQTVRMAFSLLDKSDPDREFSFTLGLTDGHGKTSDSYCATGCSPHVPELPKFLAQLNDDADSISSLPRFVCSMRRAFAKLASGGSVA